MNLPNKITLARIFLTVLIVIILIIIALLKVM